MNVSWFCSGFISSAGGSRQAQCLDRRHLLPKLSIQRATNRLIPRMGRSALRSVRGASSPAHVSRRRRSGAVHFAREGAHVVIASLSEEPDAQQTRRMMETKARSFFPFAPISPQRRTATGRSSGPWRSGACTKTVYRRQFDCALSEIERLFFAVLGGLRARSQASSSPTTR